jgi:hypothetical protein
MWSIGVCVAETWHFGKQSRSKLKVLKCGAGEEGEDQLDRSCEKWRSVKRVKKERNILQTINRRKYKYNCILSVLLRISLLKRFVEGHVEIRMEVAGKWGWKRKQLMDDDREEIGYWKLRAEALDHTAWITCLWRGYGPVVWQYTIDMDRLLGRNTTYFVDAYQHSEEPPTSVFVLNWSSRFFPKSTTSMPNYKASHHNTVVLIACCLGLHYVEYTRQAM